VLSVSGIIRRIRIGDRTRQQIAGLKEFTSTANGWFGLGPDDSPLTLQEPSTQAVYSLDSNGVETAH
jgi:hypothetical protein